MRPYRYKKKKNKFTPLIIIIVSIVLAFVVIIKGIEFMSSTATAAGIGGNGVKLSSLSFDKIESDKLYSNNVSLTDMLYGSLLASGADAPIGGSAQPFSYDDMDYIFDTI